VNGYLVYFEVAHLLPVEASFTCFIFNHPLKLCILWRHFLFGLVVVLMPLKPPLEVAHPLEALLFGIDSLMCCGSSLAISFPFLHTQVHYKLVVLYLALSIIVSLYHCSIS
jgi:hypothetical protein